MSGTSGCLVTRRGVSGITAFDSCLPTASIYIVADSKQLEGVKAVAVRTDTAASLALKLKWISQQFARDLPNLAPAERQRRERELADALDSAE